MTKKILLLIGLITVSASTFAQKSGDALRLYLGLETARMPQPTSFYVNNILNGVLILQEVEPRPVVALGYMHTFNSGFYLEGVFWYDGPIDGGRRGIVKDLGNPFTALPALGYFNRNIQVQIEGDLLIPTSWKKFRPFIGGFLRYSDQKMEMESFDAAFFGREHRNYNVQIGITPRLAYPLGKRFSIELSAPTQFLQTYLEYSNVDNPALTPEQRENKTLHFMEFFPLTQVRIGVGWHFNQGSEKSN